MFDFLLLKRFRMVLWSISVGDWRSRGGTGKIKRRLLSRLKHGDVIVLHDSGRTFGANRNAPNYMLEALADFIAATHAKDYCFVRIDEGTRIDTAAGEFRLRWYKRMLVSLWLKWEALFRFLFGLKQAHPENQLIFWRVRTYHGKNFRLSDDEEIRGGDRIVELHLNNEMLYRMAAGSKSMVQLAVILIRAVRQLLPEITQKILAEPAFSGIKCIYGITMIHRGTNQLGFSVMDLPKGVFAFIAKYYLRILLFVIHPEGKDRLKVKTDILIPKMIAMSTKELKKRYEGNGASENPVISHSALSAVEQS